LKTGPKKKGDPGNGRILYVEKKNLRKPLSRKKNKGLVPVGRVGEAHRGGGGGNILKGLPQLLKKEVSGEPRPRKIGGTSKKGT